MVVDTGIFVEHLRSREKERTTLFKIFEQEDLFITTVTLYELMAGATTEEKKREVLILTANFHRLEVTSSVALRAADIYQQLKGENKLIEFRDIFIGATCLDFEYPLLTLNLKHFRRIKGLVIIKKGGFF